MHLIGELRLVLDGRELPLPASRKTRALFVYLLLLSRPARRERLCEIFFDIPDDPRAALRWSLSKIRTMLGPHCEALLADRERVELDRSALTTDVEALAAWVENQAAPPAALEDCEAALEPALPGLEIPGLDAWNGWLAAERAGIDRLRAAFLGRVSRQEELTAEHRDLFAAEAEMLDPEKAEESKEEAEPPDTEAPSLEQHVRYCFAEDGARIAYACTGDGPPLVKAANWLNHLELDWSGPVWGRLFTELSKGHTFIRYDERGNGLSDWDVDDLSFDAFVRDLETVVDSLGLDRFPLLGISQGCAVSIQYAVRHPERVSRLILLGGYAAGWRHVASDTEAAQREAVITLAEHGWGQNNPVYRQIFSQTFMPTASHEELEWFNEFQRQTASPANAVRFLRAFAEIDVRPMLPKVKAPTLVLHSREDQRVPLAMGVELASAIPGASLVTLDSANHIPLSREPATAKIAECIRAFLSEAPKQPPRYRRLFA